MDPIRGLYTSEEYIHIEKKVPDNRTHYVITSKGKKLLKGWISFLSAYEWIFVPFSVCTDNFNQNNCHKEWNIETHIFQASLYLSLGELAFSLYLSDNILCESWYPCYHYANLIVIGDI